MTWLNVEKPLGILNPRQSETKFQLARYEPSADLSPFVLRYWSVTWDLRGQSPYMERNIPHPCVNLVIDRERSGIFGVVTRTFSHRLVDTGHVFGIKFTPGGFYPFIKTPLAQLTDNTLAIADVFGADGVALYDAVLAQPDDERRIELAECFLRRWLPAPDVQVDVVNTIVDSIIADRTITKVDDLAQRFNLSPRSLQRLFSQYVGVSPKWVIQRYRVQDAADQLVDGVAVSWAMLALDLGYSDQAHFIRDFKALVGRTPAEYARQV